MTQRPTSRRNLERVPQSGSAPPCNCGCDSQFDPALEAAAIVESFDQITDPLDVELLGAMFLASASLLGGNLEELMLEELLPAFEALGDRVAVGMLTVFSVLGEERIAMAAAARLDGLRGSANTLPAWVEQLAAPVAVRGCVALADPDGEVFLLAAYFDRPSGSHAMLIMIDPEECGAAIDIALVDADELPEALADMHQHARREGLRFVEKALTLAEFRWQAEIALDRRDEHDLDGTELLDDLYDDIPLGDDLDLGDLDLGGEELGDDDGPPYEALALLLRARLRALPLSTKPKPPHPKPVDIDQEALLSLIEDIAPLARGGRFRAPKVVKLPPKRKTRDGPAPILRLRIDLRGAKPPIWRRLEVPGDIPLNVLHQVLQSAFGWTDSHLYVFETDFGAFGHPTLESGRRSDKSATLEQVVHGTGAKLSYIYDFGDDWVHSIVVEHSGPGESSVDYPRCTGGRRAAPPEDCGGIWGYAQLLEILADPDDDEHADRLEWLGIARADHYNPAHFAIGVVNDALAGLRQTPKRRRR
ncbi:plasmid pRiA4b ORF-3 family protein [Nocardia sp. R16R-3T]